MNIKNIDDNIDRRGCILFTRCPSHVVATLYLSEGKARNPPYQLIAQWCHSNT